MTWTRRRVLRHGALGAGACSLGGVERALAAAAGGGWTGEWDRAAARAEIARYAATYDAAESMTTERRGPEFNYQTNVRSRVVHTPRESVQYASLLLGAGDAVSVERALAILRRVLPLQIQDPASRYFGLWSWYWEEPVEQMRAVDFNWADFLGSGLLMILLLHAERLPEEMVAAIRTAIHNAAISIQKRNVTLSYTNIAFMGTFVTLAAGEMLGDAGILAYAKDRCVRLAATIDASGSFAEYNSPTYLAVTIENLSRILTWVKDAGSRAIAARLNGLAWKHIGEHWHAPTMQLAGPMSRAYSNDLGTALWIQKGTRNRVRFLGLEQLPAATATGIGVAETEFHCPEELVGLFGASPRHQHREIFSAAPAGSAAVPVEGTTWLTPKFALGSVNRGDFWIQRRPLLAYWGDATRPPRVMQMRVLKDEYDFTSALLYSAQQQGSVLGSVRFRSDGGDKHPSLDPIKDGMFTATRMRVQMFFGRWDAANRVLVDGKAMTGESFTVGAKSRVAIEAGGVVILFQAFFARFLEPAKTMVFAREGEDATLSLELMSGTEARTVRWSEVSDPGCDFVLEMGDGGGSLEAADTAFAKRLVTWKPRGEMRDVSWGSRDGALAVATETGVGTLVKMDEAYKGTVDGKACPMVRLEDAPVHWG